MQGADGHLVAEPALLPRVAMSQKSSIPQVTRIVSGALPPDNLRHPPRCLDPIGEIVMLCEHAVTAVAEEVLGAGRIDGIMNCPGCGSNPSCVVERQVEAEGGLHLLLEGIVEGISCGRTSLG